jgi:hypothetical protein
MRDLTEKLVPGQKVRVVRMVAIAVDVDIEDFLDDSGDLDITVGMLENRIVDDYTIEQILDEFDEYEISEISTEVTEIN